MRLGGGSVPRPRFFTTTTTSSSSSSSSFKRIEGADDLEFENVASDREAYANWQRSQNGSDGIGGGGGGISGATSKNLLWYFFLVVILAAVVIAIALLVHTLLRSSTTILVGPPGPPGSCNLTQVNQTFNIFGNTNIGGNATVNGSLTINNSLTIYYDNASKCVAFDTTKSGDSPICFDSCIETNCITALYGSNSTANVTFDSNVFFNDTVYVNQTLWIGRTELVWTGTTLLFVGNVTLPPQSGSGIVIGTVGNISADGNCLLINATQCLEIQGNTTFLSPITGPFVVNGEAVFYPSVYLYNQSYGLYLLLSGTNTTEDDLSLFSLNYLSLDSPVGITIESPLTVVEGNFTVTGVVKSPFTIRDSLVIECAANTTDKVTFGYDALCQCMDVASSTSGVCFNLENGVTVNGPGSLNVNGTNMTFANGAAINSNVVITGNLTVDQNIIVDGNLVVEGTVVYENLTVTGNLTVEGGLNVTSGMVTFLDVTTNVLKANQIVSQNITTFEGLGAVYNSGTTLQVDGSLEFNVLASNLFCMSPIFIPNTPSTPTNNSCVLACTDMSQCTTTINNLIVAQSFSVGNSANFSLIGSVSLGVIGAQQLSSMQINTVSLEIDSTDAVKIDNDLNVEGDILQGSNTHPCCLGQQVNTGSRTVIVQMAVTTATIATSETTVVPFNSVTNPIGSLTTSWSTSTYTFTAPASGWYGVTVYLQMNPSQSNLGSLRGVTLLKSYSYPSATPAKTRICAQPTNGTGTATLMQVTCTFGAYFGGGDTFQVLVYYDYTGSLTLYGDLTVASVPSTRLEIYQF